MFWYLALFPVVGLIAGLILLANRDEFGGVLILGSLIGAWRVRDFVRRALRAARTPHRAASKPLRLKARDAPGAADMSADSDWSM